MVDQPSLPTLLAYVDWHVYVRVYVLEYYEDTECVLASR